VTYYNTFPYSLSRLYGKGEGRKERNRRNVNGERKKGREVNTAKKNKFFVTASRFV